VTWEYFFVVWFINVNTYKCIWLSKSFAVELIIAYTWLGRHTVVRDGKNDTHLMGVMEEVSL